MGVNGMMEKRPTLSVESGQKERHTFIQVRLHFNAAGKVERLRGIGRLSGTGVPPVFRTDGRDVRVTSIPLIQQRSEDRRTPAQKYVGLREPNGACWVSVAPCGDVSKPVSP